MRQAYIFDNVYFKLTDDDSNDSKAAVGMYSVAHNAYI